MNIIEKAEEWIIKNSFVLVTQLRRIDSDTWADITTMVRGFAIYLDQNYELVEKGKHNHHEVIKDISCKACKIYFEPEVEKEACREDISGCEEHFYNYADCNGCLKERKPEVKKKECDCPYMSARHELGIFGCHHFSPFPKAKPSKCEPMEKEKPMLFVPFSEDDFLPGNLGVERLNEIIWLLIENLNELKSAKEKGL